MGSPIVPAGPRYTLANQLPRELKAHCQIYLEEHLCALPGRPTSPKLPADESTQTMAHLGSSIASSPQAPLDKMLPRKPFTCPR